MFKIFKKYSISFLDKGWKPIFNHVKRLKFIPRQGELVFIEEENKYYKVINVIYYLNDKQGIFVIVEEFSDKNVKH